MISRRNLLGAKRKQVIMVDHNEPDQAVRGIRDAEILEILDHHRLGTVETASPVYFRCEPLGCTATIVWECYHEHGVEIPRREFCSRRSSLTHFCSARRPARRWIGGPRQSWPISRR